MAAAPQTTTACADGPYAALAHSRAIPAMVGFCRAAGESCVGEGGGRHAGVVIRRVHTRVCVQRALTVAVSTLALSGATCTLVAFPAAWSGGRCCHAHRPHARVPGTGTVKRTAISGARSTHVALGEAGPNDLRSLPSPSLAPTAPCTPHRAHSRPWSVYGMRRCTPKVAWWGA